MGNYTKLHARIKLKDDTPQDVQNSLDCMLTYNLSFTGTPEHPFWYDERCGAIGSKDPASKDIPSFTFPNLVICCEIKNYDETIQKFLDWITPYVETIEGTYHYEECPVASPLGIEKVNGAPRIYILYVFIQHEGLGMFKPTDVVPKEEKRFISHYLFDRKPYL